MGCGKSKQAVATATAPTAVERNKLSSKKKSRGDKKEPVTPNDAADQEIKGIDGEFKKKNDEHAAVETPANEENQGKLISRESPGHFFSSRKDDEFVVGDLKSDGDCSEYASPRTESTGRESSFSQRNAGGEAVEAGKGK